MLCRVLVTTTFSMLICVSLLAEEPETSIPPVTAIDGIKPNHNMSRIEQRDKPLELRSIDAAAEYFNGETLKKLKKKVNFENQFVLICCWHGSGEDKLTCKVARSNPRQVQFTIQSGNTFDLISHLEIFAVRNNVKWSLVRE